MAARTISEYRKYVVSRQAGKKLSTAKINQLTRQGWNKLQASRGNTRKKTAALASAGPGPVAPGQGPDWKSIAIYDPEEAERVRRQTPGSTLG